MENLSLQLKRHRVKKRDGESDSKLYGGNCSRPVQMTLFLAGMSLVLLVLVAAFLGGLRHLFQKEENLERKSFVVVDVHVSESHVYLYEDAETFYDFNQTDLPTYDWSTLTGTRITVLTNDATGVWALCDRYGNEVFGFEDYYNANKSWAIVMTVICGLLALIPLTFLVVAFLAYKDPDEHPELWVWMETMNFWRRHGP